MKKKKKPMPEQMEKVATQFFFIFVIFFFFFACLLSSFRHTVNLGFFWQHSLSNYQHSVGADCCHSQTALRHLDSVNLLDFLDRMCIEMLFQVYAPNAISCMTLLWLFVSIFAHLTLKCWSSLVTFFFGYWIQCIRV